MAVVEPIFRGAVELHVWKQGNVHVSGRDSVAAVPQHRAHIQLLHNWQEEPMEEGKWRTDGTYPGMGIGYFFPAANNPSTSLSTTTPGVNPLSGCKRILSKQIISPHVSEPKNHRWGPIARFTLIPTCTIVWASFTSVRVASSASLSVQVA